MSWDDLLEQWGLVVADLADLGVDVWDRSLMRSRPWAWLHGLVENLLTRPPASFYRVPIDDKHEGFKPAWPNRVQAHFFEPRWRAS